MTVNDVTDMNGSVVQNFKKSIEIYQCDTLRRLKINEIFNFLQEAAEGNANRLGAGNQVKDGKDLRWIVLDYEMEINRFPVYKENITVQSWPSDEVSLYAIRDFRILSLQNEVLISATSRWVMVDFARMRPIAFSKALQSMPLYKERACPSDFAKITPLKDFDDEREIIPRYIELDANNHVNNAAYAAWLYDCLPPDFLADKELQHLRINFKSGIPAKHTARILTKISENTSRHDILLQENDTAAAFIEAVWANK